jgi:hypothetical protein
MGGSHLNPDGRDVAKGNAPVIQMGNRAIIHFYRLLNPWAYSGADRTNFVHV